MLDRMLVPVVLASIISILCACVGTSDGRGRPAAILSQADLQVPSSTKSRLSSSREAASGSSVEDSALIGAWKGAIVVEETPIYLKLRVESSEGGWRGVMDVPEIDAQDEPVSNITFVDDRIRFELAGEPESGVFEATVHGDRMQGTFHYLDIDGIFWAELIEGTNPSMQSKYRQLDVKVKNQDVTLAGTLTLPSRKGKHPAVLIVSGAGPDERDRDVAGFPLFQVLAHQLSSQGYAVLRMDDRGAGLSTGELAQSTRHDLAKDALASVRYLREHPRVDPARVGIIGYSEGSLVAPMAALSSDDVAFVVLLAGSAISGKDTMLQQTEEMLRDAGIGDAQIEKQLTQQKEVFRYIEENEDWNGLEDQLVAWLQDEYEQLPEEEQSSLGDVQFWARAAAAEQVAAMKSPWFRSFLLYDPAPKLAQLQIPTLAIFGELDAQLVVDENVKAMENAFQTSGNPNAKVEVIPRSNHLLQEAHTGSVAEYPSLDPRFSPLFISTLVGWLNHEVRDR